MANKRKAITATVLLTTMCMAAELFSQSRLATVMVLDYAHQSATPSLSAELLWRLADYFESKQPFRGRTFLRGRAAHSPEAAKTLLEKYKPVLALCPAGFYLSQFASEYTEARPICSLMPQNSPTQKYYLVTSSAGPDSIIELDGHTVRAALGFDNPFLQRVVFPGNMKPGSFFQLEPSVNLKDHAFLMIDCQRGGFNAGEVGAPSALLLDESTRQTFERDGLIWPELKTIWISEEVPQPLVIAIGEQWSSSELLAIKQTLLRMHHDAEGATILRLLHASRFDDIDFDLLNRAQAHYLSYGESVQK